MSELDKILCSSYVLESSRNELEMYQDRIKQLYKLLLDAYHERDEARQQLQKSEAEISELRKLLNQCLPSSSAEINHKPKVTEPILDYIVEANNNQSYVFSPSTPADCISDVANSPAMSNASLSESSNLQMPNVQGLCGLVWTGKRTIWSKDLMLDHASMVIDNLVKGRPLPEKGKLVQAVVAAEPLLETVLLAGRLPRWRNPPTMSSVRTEMPNSVTCLHQSSLQHQSSSGIMRNRFQQ
ncbi:hypothetical protein SLEP1_g53786 [Rubroshorea leprosula]|uniref:Uncharacterized protein n=1 Tax=Rubroshorea leprosula TaxID=152421 RepID=A0AAV5MAC6_9ROSI|nr:hypothetical protein SLEP1_g53786 [Rubroshorea leprosula]